MRALLEVMWVVVRAGRMWARLYTRVMVGRFSLPWGPPELQSAWWRTIRDRYGDNAMVVVKLRRQRQRINEETFENVDRHFRELLRVSACFLRNVVTGRP